MPRRPAQKENRLGSPHKVHMPHGPAIIIARTRARADTHIHDQHVEGPRKLAKSAPRREEPPDRLQSTTRSQSQIARSRHIASHCLRHTHTCPCARISSPCARVSHGSRPASLAARVVSRTWLRSKRMPRNWHGKSRRPLAQPVGPSSLERFLQRCARFLLLLLLQRVLQRCARRRALGRCSRQRRLARR